MLHSGLSDGERRAVREARDRAATCASSSARARPSSRRCRDVGLIVVDEEHESAYKQGDDPRYDARRVRAPSARGSRAPCSCSGRRRRGRRAGSGCRARRCRARVGGDLPRVEVVDLRRDGLYPLSRPLRDGADAARRRGRPRDPAAQPARRGARAALPQLRRGLPLRPLRRQPRAARRAAGCAAITAASPSARRATCPACGSVELARLGAGTERVSEAVSELLPHIPVLRLDADAVGAARRAGGDARALRRASPRPCSSARRWSRRGTTSAICAWRRRSTPTRASPGPTSAARSARSRCSPSSRGAAAAAATRARVVFQAWDPDQRVVRLAAEHAVEAFLAGELERRERLGYPPFRHLVRVEVAAAPARRRRWTRSSRCAPRREPALPGDELLGPAPLFRVRGRERAQLLVKTLRPARAGSAAGRARRAPGPRAAARGRERRGRRRPAVDCLRCPRTSTITSTTTSTIMTHDHDHDHDHDEAAPQQEGDRARGPGPAREMVAREPDPAVSRSPCCASPRARSSEFSDDLRALVERMVRLMDDANGVGLAGNQVGLLRRVLVYRADREDAEARRARQPGDRRALGRDARSTRRAASRSARCACRSSATCAISVDGAGRERRGGARRGRGPRGAHPPARDRPPRRRADDRPHDARGAPRGAGRPAAAARPATLSD